MINQQLALTVDFHQHWRGCCSKARGDSFSYADCWQVERNH